MKLAKLSLAAIMTVGAISTVNAQPLEEAIKNVDFTGMVRYRMDDVNQDSAGTNINTNDWDFLGKITAPVTDNMKATVAFASSGGISDNHSQAPVAGNLDIRKAFFTYKQDALTVKAGLQAIATPITDGGFNGDKGNGVVAMYTAGPVTLAGAYFGNSNTTVDEEITALAVMGSAGPVDAQLWYIATEQTVDMSLGLDVKAKFAGVSVWGQAFQTELQNVVAPAEDKGLWFGLQAGYAMDNFSVNAGYTKNDDDQGVNHLTPDGGGQIMPGWRMIYQVDNEASAETMFVDVGASFGKFGGKLGYAVAEFDATKNAASDADEIWGMVSYKVAKNFNTYVKYSVMSYDAAAIDNKEHMRFEAKYSF